MCKIKEILVEQKKHIRFGEWTANDVSNFFKLFFKNFVIIFRRPVVKSKNFWLRKKDMFGLGIGKIRK